jgi:hypothetical protein
LKDFSWGRKRKMVKSTDKKLVLQTVGVLLIPLALFWILYRYGFQGIIDAIAISVLIVVGAWFVIRFLFKQKIFSLKKT